MPQLLSVAEKLLSKILVVAEKMPARRSGS